MDTEEDEYGKSEECGSDEGNGKAAGVGGILMGIVWYRRGWQRSGHG